MSLFVFEIVFMRIYLHSSCSQAVGSWYAQARSTIDSTHRAHDGGRAVEGRQNAAANASPLRAQGIDSEVCVIFCLVSQFAGHQVLELELIAVHIIRLSVESIIEPWEDKRVREFIEIDKYSRP